VSKGRPTVILQGTEHRVRVDLIAWAIQKAAAVIAANIIAVRSDRAIYVSVQVVVQDGASDSQPPSVEMPPPIVAPLPLIVQLLISPAVPVSVAIPPP
jgi:hypothetical protein